MTDSYARYAGSLSRRRFLAGTAGLAGLAASGAGVAGCASDGGGGAAAPNKKSVPLPTFVPYDQVKPDLAAGPHGVPAGFFHYPADPASFIDHKMGNGGSISFLVQGTSLVPKEKNTWLRAVMKAVNSDFDLQVIPSIDYEKKFQVVIAGGNLPDVIQVQTVANLPQVLEKEFADLSDHLSGDNIKNYPGLASIQAAAWQIPMLNGRIWGVPNPRPAAGFIVSTRGDILREFGIGSASPELGSGADFLELCKNLTDKKRGKYALGALPTAFILPALLEMAGAPNNWTVKGGKFTSVNETDEMKLALEQVTTMWKEGYIHPDSFGTPGNNITWWSGGVTALYGQSFAGWSAYSRLNPTWDLGVLTLPKWDGGGTADKILGMPGYGQYAALKKAEPSRIKEILRVFDFFAAPFGTKEYLSMNFGVEGVDYTLEGTDPVVTKQGSTEQVSPLYYCGSQLFQNIYVPGAEDVVKAEHEYLTKVMPTGVSDPTWGLYSETASTKGATAATNLLNAQGDIIQGRRKLSEWDSLVKTWRKDAGDAMRGDYEKAYASLHPGG